MKTRRKPVQIEYDYFANEAQVQAEIASAGHVAVPLSFDADENSDHWHDFNARVYVVDGVLEITLTESGESCHCGPGTRITAPAGFLHREKSSGYKAIVGFEVHPDELSQPLNKPPPVWLAGE
jgi:hypothetical protein